MANDADWDAGYREESAMEEIMRKNGQNGWWKQAEQSAAPAAAVEADFG